MVFTVDMWIWGLRGLRRMRGMMACNFHIWLWSGPRGLILVSFQMSSQTNPRRGMAGTWDGLDLGSIPDVLGCFLKYMEFIPKCQQIHSDDANYFEKMTNKTLQCRNCFFLFFGIPSGGNMCWIKAKRNAGLSSKTPCSNGCVLICVPSTQRLQTLRTGFSALLHMTRCMVI